MLFVAADPIISNICISSPAVGEAGRVKVLAAEVSTKYLLFEERVIFEDTEFVGIGTYPVWMVTHEADVPFVVKYFPELLVCDGKASTVADPPRETAEPLIVIELFVNAELGIFTKFAPDVPAGSVTVPVNVGEARFAFKLRAVWVAVDTGLFASLVLSTFPRPTIVAVIPETVPVNGWISKC